MRENVATANFWQRSLMLASHPSIIYMAPMVGISDAAFRIAFLRHFGGIDRAISPFLRTVQGGDCKGSKLGDLNPKRQAALELYPQILSNQAEDFIAVAKRLFHMGYLKINLNLGCPVPMAAGRGRGAGLLPYPEYVDRLLHDILDKIPNQLSVKVRLGYESDRDLDGLCPVFNRYPLFAVAIHPRTAKQGYGGAVDLGRFAAAAANLRSPVIYSGDITSVDDFLRLRQQFPGVQQWMLGRGLLRDPCLALAIQASEQGIASLTKGPPSWAEMADFFEDIKRELHMRRWEDHSILLRLKTQFYYRAEAVDLDRKSVKLVRKTSRCEEFLAILRRL